MDVKQLIANYGVAEKEFDVKLDKGEIFTFRAITDYSELQMMKKKAAEFSRLIEKGKYPENWKPYLPDKTTAGMLYMLISTLVKPKLSQLDWLMLAKEAGWMVEFVMNEVAKHQTNIFTEIETDEIDELKND